MKTNTLLFFLFLLIISTQSVEALKCAPPNLETSYNQFDHVIIGQVNGIRHIPDPTKKNSTQLTHSIATVLVKENLKKWVPENVEVYSEISWGDLFIVGNEYLMFLNNIDNRLTAQYCSGTTMLLGADNDALNKLRQLNIRDY